MDKTLIINRIKKHYGFNKDSDFANYLGISPQVLSNWKSRNTYDAELIYTKCVEVAPEWLLTGKGEMIKTEAPLKRLQHLKKLKKEMENNDFFKHKSNAVEDKSNTYISAPLMDYKDMVIKLQEEIINLMAINKKLELRIKDLEGTGVSNTNAKSA